MVLCEIMNGSELGFVETWLLLTVAGFLSFVLISGVPFVYYYVYPTYDKWLMKTNRNYPSVELVRSEIYKSGKGVPVVVLCPTLALYLAKIGKYSQGHCSIENGWKELAIFICIFFAVDFFEWAWHFMGHRFDALWEIHRPHHKYHNPTPWAVIADDAPDQIVRGSPLFMIPLLFPVNVDLLFLQFILFFNFYGTMIHCGIDWDFLPIHNQSWLNTPYHHHIHHALSIKNKPLHTGFFLQIWDRMMGSIYRGEKCYCAKCDIAAGNRTKEDWERIKKDIPDYTVLLKPSFWLEWKEDSKEN
jgi:lathosterol oxidase